MFSAIPEAHLLIAALAVGLVGGVVKGMVGFALPVIILSGLSVFLAPELALAGLVVPSLVTNIWQGLRQGPRAALDSIWRMRLLFGVAMIVLVLVAQFVPHMPDSLLYLSLGTPVLLFAVTQLAGWRPEVSPFAVAPKIIAGIVAGVFGGLAGLFGPPLVVYLTATNTPKTEQVRTQGVVFALGLMFFAGAHLVSGVVRFETLVFSSLITFPALIGVYIGFQIQDRVDQNTFRTITLLVLLFAALNLIRRGLMG